MPTDAQILAAHRELVDALANENRLHIAYRGTEEVYQQAGQAWHAAQAKTVACRNRIADMAKQEAGQPRTTESKVEVKPAEVAVDDNKPKPATAAQPAKVTPAKARA